MRFYLGTHQPGWLDHVDFPLCVSHTRLSRDHILPEAREPVMIDSGAFSILQRYGYYPDHHSPRRIRQWSAEEYYVWSVRRYVREIGHVEVVWPQDHMCEPAIINGGTFGRMRFAGTHLSVVEHQMRTIVNGMMLRDMAGEIPWRYVLQGFTRDDYVRCADMYDAAGVDLTREPLVGLGSICRRSATEEIGRVVAELHSMGIRLHGFGIKTTGLRKYGHLLTSADSMAWGERGSHVPGCSPTHATESNCLRFATAWRARLIGDAS